MMPLNDGDATFTGSFTRLGWDEAGNQYEAGFKPPKGTKFVVMLLGTAPKDATDYDLEAALARLGFVRRTMLEKILPFAEQHLDHELFGGGVKEMEAALELIREAKELLS